MLHVSDRHKRGVSTEPKRKSHRWRPTSRVKTYRTRAQQRQLRQGRCQVSDRHLQLLHCLVYQWDRHNNTLKQHHQAAARSCAILHNTKAGVPRRNKSVNTSINRAQPYQKCDDKTTLPPQHCLLGQQWESTTKRYCHTYIRTT